MSLKKRTVFAVLSVVLVALCLEGVARVIWWRLATNAFELTKQRGLDLMQNSPLAAIHFMMEPSGLYTYTLKPGFNLNGAVVNFQGFAQRETVPLERTPGVVRFVALGESTTQGHDVDKGCYPTYLRNLLQAQGSGYQGVEHINGGVAGWVSDQIALRVEHQIAAYQPDFAVLYCGWNDFISYDPCGYVTEASAFDISLGGSNFHTQAASYFKSVALLSALYQKKITKPRKERPIVKSQDTTPEELYKYYLKSLDRIIAALKQKNPQVRICICTLVGRWPYGTQADFETPTGSTWWMKCHKLSPTEAQEQLRRFNEMIRTYAVKNNLMLLDTAADYEELDRSRLQWDFAHMTFDGYELLAECMYDRLLEAAVIQGKKSARRDQLLVKYQRTNPAPAVSLQSNGE